MTIKEVIKKLQEYKNQDAECKIEVMDCVACSAIDDPHGSFDIGSQLSNMIIKYDPVSGYILFSAKNLG